MVTIPRRNQKISFLKCSKLKGDQQELYKSMEGGVGECKEAKCSYRGGFLNAANT